MKYVEPKPIGRSEATRVFNEGTRDQVCDALVAVAIADPDWRWAQERCLEFLSHEDDAIRGLAATCLGHIARIHRQLDLERVRFALQTLAADPDVGGRAIDALDDIDMYMGKVGR